MTPMKKKTFKAKGTSPQFDLYIMLTNVDQSELLGTDDTLNY